MFIFLYFPMRKPIKMIKNTGMTVFSIMKRKEKKDYLKVFGFKKKKRKK